jgi:hypothetical protein
LHLAGVVIKGMGALTSLNMSENGLLSKEGGTVLREMLKGHTLLKELDVSSSGEGMPHSKRDGPGFAKELAVGIKDNGALTSLDISNNQLVGGIKRVKQKETPSWWDVSNHGVYGSRDDHYDTIPDMDGIIAIVNAIKDMGALSELELDVRDNTIPPAEKVLLQGACDAKGVYLRV